MKSFQKDHDHIDMIIPGKLKSVFIRLLIKCKKYLETYQNIYL